MSEDLSLNAPLTLVDKDEGPQSTSSISIGAIVLSTNKGIEGIELKKKNPPFIFNNSKKLLKLITYVLKNNNKIKKISVKNRSFYMKKYSMESITKDFLKKNFKDLFNNNI